MNIACNSLIKNKLLNSLDEIINVFKKKSKEFSKIIKIGRTHTQDATPLTLGQEFSGYLTQIINAKKRIISSKNELCF